MDMENILVVTSEEAARHRGGGVGGTNCWV